MLDGGNSVDSSALAIGTASIRGSFLSFGKPPTKANCDDHWCKYCRKTGHTKEMCFKLHGKEKVLEQIRGFKGTAQRHANQALSDSESVASLPFPQVAEKVPTLNKEELEHLRSYCC